LDRVVVFVTPKVSESRPGAHPPFSHSFDRKRRMESI
jgi:hypothetical protein